MKIAIVDSREYGGTCPQGECDSKELFKDIAHIANRTIVIGEGIVIKTPLMIKGLPL